MACGLQVCDLVCRALAAQDGAEALKAVKQAREPLRLATESVTDLQPAKMDGEGTEQVSACACKHKLPPSGRPLRTP